MPPWVGNPYMVQPLPENKRYVCVACCFIDPIHVNSHQSLDSVESSGSSVNRVLQPRKPSKCTVVVIDSYTLTIVQSVFDGNLSIGPLKFMSIVMPSGDLENQSVLMVDSFGGVQCVSLLKSSDQNGEISDALRKNPSNMEVNSWVHGSKEGELPVAFATRGQVLVLLHGTYCVFRLVDGGSRVGDISFLNDQLCPEGNFRQYHVVGGMFLEYADDRLALDADGSHNTFSETFLVWNNKGCAIMYSVSYSGKTFKYAPLCGIPAVSNPPNMQLSLSFVQLSGYLLRIEAVVLNVEEPMQSKPLITIWSLPGKDDKFSEECKLLGKGSFFQEWMMDSATPHQTDGIGCNVSVKPTGQDSALISQQNFAQHVDEFDDLYMNDEKSGLCRNRWLVSSSMVISENCHTPYAIVYGFYNGEIEVLRFDSYFDGLNAHTGSTHDGSDSSPSKQYLSGHTGAVLCLAAHQVVGTSEASNCNHCLISGSSDCTIRVWDLNTTNLIMVMHQHVLPVRQIILPPPHTDRPWNNCFLSVGEDSCVALSSLETLRVERMFPGHPYIPSKVVWDSRRGYVACLCLSHSGQSDPLDVLYIWDVKSGTRERVLRASAAHSMFDHFCTSISSSYFVVNGMEKNTSASSLHLPIIEDAQSSQYHLTTPGKGIAPTNSSLDSTNIALPSTYPSLIHPITCSCPFPGIATLSFDITLIMSLCQKPDFSETGSNKPAEISVEQLESQSPRKGYNRMSSIPKNQGIAMPNPDHMATDDGSNLHTPDDSTETDDWFHLLEGCLLRFSLSFLHLWNVDCELDKLLVSDMKLKRPNNYVVASGLAGDRGSLTLTFPGPSATLELWKSSSEFCAIRSLTMLALAQHMITLSHSCSRASSALAAFYTRKFAEKNPDIKPPLLELLVSFWQDKNEHIRMAARSLFHCAASRAIPLPLRNEKSYDHEKYLCPSHGIVETEIENSSTDEAAKDVESERKPETPRNSQTEDSKMLAWLESFEVQDWISCVGGTSQDAMTSRVVVAAALAVWYPSLVKPSLAMLVVHPLMKLVMAMSEKYSSTAAEILAEGMESTWRICIASEVPRLIADIFFQIECVSGAYAKPTSQKPEISSEIRESLVGILLPSLAMADIPGFLHVIESQIWSTASDSPVHVVALSTLFRVLRGSPRNLAPYLDKVVNFILQTMDPGNLVMRRSCFQSSLATLKELVRVFPMVSLNDSSTRLAVGDAIGDINSSTIRVYDMQSMTKIKVLDSSGPPGLPTLLGEASEMTVNTAISVLSFSPDGEGLVAFSEHGLTIRWWSLGSVWWERLSRNLVPVQCTKLIFVPPWEGFSPNSMRSSIMASVLGNQRQSHSQEHSRDFSETDRLKILLHNLDLSYRLEWPGARKVVLKRHGHELGIFQLY